MTESGASLEGWAPEVGPDLSLAELVDLAFDYRGHVTLVRRDGTEVSGYLFNRDAETAEPFVEMFDLNGSGPTTIPYALIRTIRFTGKDMASGKSYEAWLKGRAQGAASPAASVGPGG